MCNTPSIVEIMRIIPGLLTLLQEGWDCDNGQLSGRIGRRRREELSWCFQASEAPEDRVENTIVRTPCFRVLVGIWKMETLFEAAWAKENGVIFLCRALGNSSIG